MLNLVLLFMPLFPFRENILKEYTPLTHDGSRSISSYLSVRLQLCIFTAITIEFSSESRDLYSTRRARVREHNLNTNNDESGNGTE